MENKGCRHEADISVFKLARVLFAGKAMINGELTGWRFKCKNCGARLKYFHSFAKVPKFWERTHWYVSGAVLLPVVIAMIVLGHTVLDEVPTTALTALVLLAVFIAAIAIAGFLGNLLFCLLIKKGKIGKFVSVSQEEWEELIEPMDSLSAPERRNEIKAQRAAAIFIACFFLLILIGIAVLAAAANK